MAALTLGRAEEIGDDRAKSFDTPNGRLFVVRSGGALQAYWDACPHYGDTPMAWRAGEYLNAARDRIVCASHGAEFDIQTGLCTKGAALGKRLTKAPVEMNVGGELVLRADNQEEEQA